MFLSRTRTGFSLAILMAAASAAPVLTAAPQAPVAAPTTEQSVAPDMHMRSPVETIAALQLPPGFHLELVAAEPDIISPVVCAWDGNGRMYVAEMRSYMLNINGEHEKDPISRVSRWESTKGDGVYDKHSVFIDHMMLPRMVLPLDDRILVRETDTKDIYCYRDTKGTGTADEKTIAYAGGPCGGNLEHQASGLLWNIDNWAYTSVENTRYRFSITDKGVTAVTDKLKSTQLGQWGLALDDTGRLFCNTAGGENPGWGFQVSPVYADLRLPGELAEGFVAVHPLLKLTDVQGGPSRLWPGGGLNHFTGCAGGSIYRGDALPGDMYGDYILPEPVGRLIRRAKVNNEHGKLVLTNADDPGEFIRSADPNFRPVWTATGPDGCLYICDMYHGIIQESAWTREGSYLRPQIQKYGLDQNINGGRIYRLVHDGGQRRPAPHMLDEKTADLVAHLSDPNGWWRDTAQKLIVLRNDKSVVAALLELARSSSNPIARLHAFWTLDGLGALDDAFVLEKLKDSDGRVRAAALRHLDPALAKGDAAAFAAAKPMATDPDPNVVIQYLMSVQASGSPFAPAIVQQTVAANAANPVIAEVAKTYKDSIDKHLLESAVSRDMLKKNPKMAESWLRGRELFQQTCIACHGPDGRGAPVPGGAAGATLAPPLRGSKRLTGNKEITCRIVLHGLVGPNDGGKLYPGEMAGFKFADDAWIADVVTYVRNDFGNHAPPLTAADLKKVRAETADRNKPFTLAELKALNLPEEKPEPLTKKKK